MTTNHDAILYVFSQVAGPIVFCNRGGRGDDTSVGYTHIHGPNRPPCRHRCTNHMVCVEKFNGTVAIATPIGEKLGGAFRPRTPITDDPLGYSHRDNYGRFSYAFTFDVIHDRWPSLEQFAIEVVAAIRRDGAEW